MERERRTDENDSGRAKLRLLFPLVCGAAVIAAARVAAPSFPVNRSQSMPRGIYRVTSEPIGRGAIVGACLPERYGALARERGYLDGGSCPGGVRPVMKRVAAIPGDIVEVGLGGVRINGEALANTALVNADARGRAVPNQSGSWRVGEGEYWLIANRVAGSLDSRYFGPVRETLGVVEPVLTETQLCALRSLRSYLRCE